MYYVLQLSIIYNVYYIIILNYSSSGNSSPSAYVLWLLSFILQQFHDCCIFDIILIHFKGNQKLWFCIWESLLKDQILDLSYMPWNFFEGKECLQALRASDSHCFSLLCYCCNANLLIQMVLIQTQQATI